MSKERRKYTREFKLEAVRLSNESDKPVVEVAHDLGIDVKLLYRWRGRYRNHGEQAFPGSGQLTEPDEELRRLRRELETVQQERDILKKALAIFSKEQR